VKGLKLKRRHIIEALVAVLFTVAAVVTAFVPNWIERISDLEPDAGSGEAEWMIVAVLGVIALILIFDVVNAIRRAARQGQPLADGPGNG
jgi:hypothetical protein